MSLHLPSQVRNHFLRGFGEQLRQREGSQSLNNSCAKYARHDWCQHLDLPLADDVVHQILRRSRQDQSRESIDGHEHKAQRQEPTPRLHQRPDVGKILPRGFLVLLTLGGYWGCYCRSHDFGRSVLSGD